MPGLVRKTPGSTGSISVASRSYVARWKTTNVQSSGSSTNLIGAQEFAQGNSGSGSHVDFNQLGIAASAVEQVTINHPDVKIAELSQSGSAAVPGESVLVEGPNTIIFDVCNTFFEARRE